MHTNCNLSGLLAFPGIGNEEVGAKDRVVLVAIGVRRKDSV